MKTTANPSRLLIETKAAAEFVTTEVVLAKQEATLFAKRVIKLACVQKSLADRQERAKRKEWDAVISTEKRGAKRRLVGQQGEETFVLNVQGK